MSHAKTFEQEKQVYRIQGLDCANCARIFEQNVKNIDGVEDAKVNFGAAKITVIGDHKLEQVQEAGAFEKLQISPVKAKQEMPEKSFWQKYGVLIISFMFLVAGYVSNYTIGEDSLVTIASFFLSIAIGGYSIFKVGLRNLTKLQFDMKTLMTIAIIGAAIIGEWSEGAVVVILFAISEALEHYSMEKARKSITSLMDIAPKTALVRRNGKEMEVSVDDIVLKDIMLVKPGQKIAMDGKVVKGHSNVNQSAITGESIPVEKSIGDDVYAGTLNAEGMLEIEVTKLVDDTTIAKMIHLVEEAQGERAPAQAFVDVFAKYYTPAIIVVAFLVAIIPPLFFGGEWVSWIYQGLAVLVVGCPCALVISTPVAIVTAIGNAAKKGVLIKGGIHLEEVRKIKAIAFDKTGTLTKGVPAVTNYDVLSGDNRETLFGKIAALEAFSQHPLSQAFIKKAEQDTIAYKSYEIEAFTSVIGKGIQGKIDGEQYYIGNAALLKETVGVEQVDAIEQRLKVYQHQGKTAMLIGKENQIVAIVAVADEVRESSKEVVSALHAQGIEHTIMLTGDSAETAFSIADAVGVSRTEANLLPQHKLEKMKELKQQYEHVAMVGDGVNDAPALAAANIGIAMGGVGSDTALETADIALMGDDLHKLPFVIKLSKKTMSVIKQNITFALGLKLIALLLVVPGWLTLWIAIFADLGATLLVTLNSLRLLRVKE
ncbi:cadmium-translocating P-type ATPase [Bacillus sp. AGMB 02131]|uniref:Cd(2+)-exporting ATPase n=1 Tax=Peribacillus faecalis TaxID=2772559 RepID=A0A927HB36_9BACI|nr:heavy metal translocating P-type ATPase [Peribacillus faecalis]MBD3108579.1 cadmium-translocating P-type ATPase [Peribacillus faecalis]